MRIILIVFCVLFSIHATAAKIDEKIVLVCDVEVLKVVEIDGDIANTKLIRQDRGAMVINGPAGTVRLLNIYQKDYEISRGKDQFIFAGPGNRMILPETGEVFDTISPLLELDPFTRRFIFRPSAEVDQLTGKIKFFPLGSIFYEGTCDKAEEPAF